MAGGVIWEHPPASVTAAGDLLTRIGGRPAVNTFIDGLYDQLLKSGETSPLLLKSQMAQKQDVYIALLKERSVDYLECVWGGDRWEGQDMFKAHAHLHISQPVWDLSKKMAATVLKTMKLPSEVTNEILKQYDLLGEPVVDPGGKFHAWVDKKSKELEAKCLDDGAVDLHGMGFTTSPEMIKNMQDKADRAQATKDKLAALRHSRKLENGEKSSPKKTAGTDGNSVKYASNGSTGTSRSSIKVAEKAGAGTGRKIVKDAAANPKHKAKGKTVAKTEVAAKTKSTPEATKPSTLETSAEASTASGPGTSSGASFEVSFLLPEEGPSVSVPQSRTTPLPDGFIKYLPKTTCCAK